MAVQTDQVPQVGVGAGAPDTLPPCAGVGDANETALICKVCRDCLCTDAPEMPWCALANLLWGGREHPLYQNLSEAMQMLLSRGRPYFRKIVLGKGDPAEVSGGLLGNGILLVQPTTGEIQSELPPPNEAFCDVWLCRNGVCSLGR